MVDVISSGQELEFVANPTKQWTLRLTYAHTQRGRANYFGERDPWLVRQNYLRDVIATPRADVTRDMTFTRRPAPAPMEEIAS